MNNTLQVREEFEETHGQTPMDLVVPVLYQKTGLKRKAAAWPRLLLLA